MIWGRSSWWEGLLFGFLLGDQGDHGLDTGTEIEFGAHHFAGAVVLEEGFVLAEQLQGALLVEQLGRELGHGQFDDAAVLTVDFADQIQLVVAVDLRPTLL